jgi:hypothetical protein
MIETGRTDAGLAAELAGKLQNDPRYRFAPKMKITDRSVGRWRKGLFAPRLPEHLTILAELSGGRVTAQTFVETRLRHYTAQPFAEARLRHYTAQPFAEARLRHHMGPKTTPAELQRYDSEATEVTKRILEQLRGVRRAVAALAIADAAASLLGTQDDRLVFERLLKDRMKEVE